MRVKRQEIAVLDYMRTHPGITQLEATAELGITRLAAVVWNLEHKRGFVIQRERITVPTRYGSTTVTRYFL